MQAAVGRKWMDGARNARRTVPRRGRSPWTWIALVAAAALVVLGAIVWALTRPAGNPEDNTPDGAPTKIRDVSRRTGRRHAAQPGERVARPAAVGHRPAGRDKLAEVGPAPANFDGGSESQEEDGSEKDEGEKPLFRHGAEQLLAMATPTEPGGYVPPLPEITDEGVAADLAKAMGNVIAPAPGDTERTLEIKLNVAEQKEEFRDLRAKGMTFTEYVKALRAKFNDDNAYLAEARKLDEALFRDEGVSDADYRSYRDELNRNLRERGLPELEAR